MYQMDGIMTPRWGSFARMGLPLAVCAPETTQSFEPRPAGPA